MKYFLFLLILPILKLNALTENLDLKIGANNPLTMEYLLGKSICKILNRELEISRLMGGKNKLNCNIIITNGATNNLDLIKIESINYSIFDVNRVPRNFNFRDFILVYYFNGKKKDWALVTNVTENHKTICEIKKALINNHLEMSYMHSDFESFIKNDDNNEINFLKIMKGIKLIEFKKC